MYQLDQEAWADLDEWRSTNPVKKVRVMWTDLAKKKAKKLLCTLPPEDQRRCVDMTIANGWQGIFPERVRNETNKRDNKPTRQDIHREAYRDIAASGSYNGSNLREDEVTLFGLMDEANRRDH